MRPSTNILELIGNTPIIQIDCFDTGKCSLFLKLENQNPGGSIKDRVALKMIEVAEQEGKLKPGGTIVEATAGNTGLGLALVAAQKGYRLILVIPDKMSKEKTFHLRAMGAQIVLTRSDVGKGHPQYYQDLAESIAKRENAFYVNQFGNAANPLAHETSTGPEIWKQMDGKLDAVVCGVGSSGTITGLGRYFEKTAPHVEMVLADPAGSILVHYIQTGEVLTESGSWLVEGIGEDFIPSIAELKRVKHGYSISDQESFEVARTLLRKAGVLAGSSTGTLLAGALRYCREQTEPKRVLTFACDSGNKYLSKMFDDFWMFEHGFIKRQMTGDLRDVISRRHEEGATVTVAPGDTLKTAAARMKLYDISQLPVVEGEKIVGLVDESDLLLALYRDKSLMQRPVRDVMTQKLKTVQPNTDLELLLKIFDEGFVVIVEDQGRFLGLITRMDLINYLRLKLE
ncbi:MAG: pyridoxal-phosphate dependent enzyme [Bdellovibrionota bacterium]